MSSEKPFLPNDICRCLNHGCEQRNNCLRYLAPIRGERCPINTFVPVDGWCEHLIEWRDLTKEAK